MGDQGGGHGRVSGTEAVAALANIGSHPTELQSLVWDHEELLMANFNTLGSCIGSGLTSVASNAALIAATTAPGSAV
jgi:hypothetical protein